MRKRDSTKNKMYLSLPSQLRQHTHLGAEDSTKWTRLDFYMALMHANVNVIIYSSLDNDLDAKHDVIESGNFFGIVQQATTRGLQPININKESFRFQISK